jgi:hypothetical protein
VNAAFLLVTTTWLAGADAAPTAPTTPAPAATSSVSGGCGACCDPCAKESFFDKLKAKLHHGSDCCEKPAPAPAPCPAPKCDTCGAKASHFSLNLHRSSGCCEKPACAPAPAPAPAAVGACCNVTCCEETTCSKIKGKLSGLFHHGSNACCDSCGTAAAVPAKTAEPIKAPKDGESQKLPKGDKETSLPMPTNITPVSTGTETKSPFELSPRYESRAGHAPDYSWLTGQLFYVHADGGLWVLRYAPLSTEDSNGGGVVLARDLRMDSYRDGDFVTIHGQLLGQKSSIFLGGPLYQGKTIELIERSTGE